MKTFTLLLVLLGLAAAAQAQSCAKPTNLAVSTITATTAVVSFTASPTAGGYLVRYFRTSGAGAGAIIQKSTAASPFTLTNLQPASSYTVSVGNICSTLDTLYSAPQAFATSGAGTACASVTNVQVAAVSTTSATVSFTPVGGALGYLVTYFAVGDSVNTHTITTTLTSLPLTPLLSGMRYVIRIATLCSNGTVSSPARSSFQTTSNSTACGAVTNLTVTATSNSTASVTFTPGVGNSLFYISYHLVGDSTRWVSTSSSPATLTGLVPGHTYYVQVLSSCGTSTTVVYTSSGSLAFGFRGAAALGTRAELGTGVLEIYPNPAHQTVSLRLPAVASPVSASITLLNALGQPVRTRTVALTGTTTQTQLELADLAPGLYTVRVAAAGQYASQRLAVE